MAKYDQMTVQELEGIVRDASAALAEKKEARRAELLAELEALGGLPKPASTGRLRVKQVDGGFIPTREPDGRSKPKITHRDPVSGATWTSRGQKPKWLQAYINEGRNPDDFRVTE